MSDLATKTYEVDTQALDNRFTYHAPHGDQPIRYRFLRAAAHVLAEHFVRYCPPSRELSLALTKLEEALFWANAAIARNEKEKV